VKGHTVTYQVTMTNGIEHAHDGAEGETLESVISAHQTVTHDIAYTVTYFLIFEHLLSV
jgi:hypothetical protein